MTPSPLWGEGLAPRSHLSQRAGRPRRIACALAVRDLGTPALSHHTRMSRTSRWATANWLQRPGAATRHAFECCGMITKEARVPPHANTFAKPAGLGYPGAGAIRAGPRLDVLHVVLMNQRWSTEAFERERAPENGCSGPAGVPTKAARSLGVSPTSASPPSP